MATIWLHTDSTTCERKETPVEISKVLYISRSYQDLCERKEPLVEISKVLYISHSYQDPCERKEPLVEISKVLYISRSYQDTNALQRARKCDLPFGSRRHLGIHFTSLFCS